MIVAAVWEAEKRDLLLWLHVMECDSMRGEKKTSASLSLSFPSGCSSASLQTTERRSHSTLRVAGLTAFNTAGLNMLQFRYVALILTQNQSDNKNK